MERVDLTDLETGMGMIPDVISSKRIPLSEQWEPEASLKDMLIGCSVPLVIGTIACVGAGWAIHKIRQSLVRACNIQR